MKRQKHPLQVKAAHQKPGDDLALTVALWVIGGFILVVTVIFFLILAPHL